MTSHCPLFCPVEVKQMGTRALVFIRSLQIFKDRSPIAITQLHSSSAPAWFSPSPKLLSVTSNELSNNKQILFLCCWSPWLYLRGIITPSLKYLSWHKFFPTSFPPTMAQSPPCVGLLCCNHLLSVDIPLGSSLNSASFSPSEFALQKCIHASTLI